jgi:hypothetical protein
MRSRASTQEDELCVNGMSFSARGSKWANSALVVGVQTQSVHQLAAGWEDLTMPPGREALVGVEFQRVRALSLWRSLGERSLANRARIHQWSGWEIGEGKEMAEK